MEMKVTVLGGGPGGYVAAIRAAQKGAQVTLIEKEALGGTCLNWGCIPTKSYVEKVGLYQKAQGLKEMGLEIDLGPLSLKPIKAYKDTVVAQLVNGVETLVAKNKVQLIKGKGRVLAPRQVEVATTTGENLIIDNDALILATGSQATPLPIPGIELPQVLDNRGILELEEAPESLVIIGGGVIGIEFAQIFAQLGTKVTIVEIMGKILPTFEEELVRRMQPLLKKAGITILTDTKVTGISPVDHGVQVQVEGKKQEALIVDKVLVAAGRQPNLEDINPGNLGLELQGKFIKVDTQMLTSVPNVYAIGDLVATPMLAHVASYEAEVAVKAIWGEEAEAQYTAVPSCLYTEPELASVGLTELEAKEQGINYKVGKFPFSANGRALTKGSTYGMVKIIANQEDGKVLGAHILGPQASELIHNLTLAIRWGLTTEEIGETIHAHPTLSETIMESAHSVFGKAVHSL